ncbi:hypothetical protein GGR13_001695 [Brevundimonas variabilis]|uniref:Uncharacterized protein n=1 Tax=Brevundimonas variabilis TaxID=74312 RepID=A0A7W9FE50_9CAUL|nr:hypothetical protein [Brevundimonas variabilis]
MTITYPTVRHKPVATRQVISGVGCANWQWIAAYE